MYTARMDPSPQESPDEARVLGGDPGAGRQEEVHSRPNSGSAHRGDGGDGQFADLCEPVMGSAHALGPVMLRGIFAGPLQEMTRPPSRTFRPPRELPPRPTSRSRSMASQISRTRRADSVSGAFRVSGSSSVIVATCDSTSRSTRHSICLRALGSWELAGAPSVRVDVDREDHRGAGTRRQREDPSARHDVVAAWLTELNFTGFCGFPGCLPGRMRCRVRFGGRLVDPAVPGILVGVGHATGRCEVSDLEPPSGGVGGDLPPPWSAQGHSRAGHRARLGSGSCNHLNPAS